MPYKSLIAILFLFFSLTVMAQTAVIDSLKKIVSQNKKDSTQALAYTSLASEFTRRDIPMAKHYSYNAVLLAKQLHLPLLLSAAYSNLVTMNVQTNEVDSAKYYLVLLKKLATGYPGSRVQSNYIFTAGLFYRKQGNYKASLPYMLEGLRLQIIQKDKTGMAGQYLNIGNNYLDMSEYRKAMASHLKALNLFEGLDNKRGMSLCYSAIGGDFIKLDQFAEALPYIQKSIDLRNELNDKRGKAASYINLGEIQEGLQQTDKALASYKEALSINKTLMLIIEEAKTDMTIGKFYARLNDINNANIYLKSSKDLFRKSGDTTYLATVNAEIASLQKNSFQQKNSEKTFINALNTAIRVGDKNTEISNYKFLADLYTKKKQYDKAFIYNEKYHNAYDSVQNNSLQLQVDVLEKRYNLEKKEKEISLLKKNQLLDQANLRNQKIFRYGTLIFIMMLVTMGLLVAARFRIVQKTRRLVEIEKMRNQIARNLHDDIGSTLSSINILSKVALKKAGGNPAVSRDLETIKNSSFSIMESMSDIVWAINPANDPLDKTILKMKEFAAAILEPAGIDFSFSEEGKLADLKLGVDERKNFYLIFKEAVNNIAKYSSAISAVIILQKNAHEFVLRISDNGTGFESTRQYTGNGLKNMQNRANEMNAIFKVDSNMAGTSICVTMSIT